MALKSLKLGKWQALLPAISDREPALMRLTPDELRKESLSLRHRAKCLEPLDRLLPEAYALVREAARRSINMRHFDVQVLGGIAMHHRSIVEMQTGEGKTLTATLPIYLNALIGRGAHLATINPYLARRDAEWMGPIYQMLGLSVGVIVPGMADADRRRSYEADVTYGAGNEFGFDFLRDRLLLRAIGEGAHDLLGGMLGDREAHERPMQRSAHLMIVDEADSILIDGAVTPLIIGTTLGEKEKVAAECYRWSAEVARQFQDVEHYDYDTKKKSVELTAVGRRLVRDLAKPSALDSIPGFTIYEYVERAIMVNRAFTREQRYIVRDGEIVVVDEYTGRLAESVKWTHGIHQALEAKEGLAITPETGHSARITVQNFYSRYEKLAGMTGTALSSSRELRKIYRVRVVEIPVNRPPLRERWSDRIFGTNEQKLAAIVDEVKYLHGQGRPVLIGTRSIDKSEELSRLLSTAGIEHQVLNAHRIASEAEIVAAAGQRGKVTVSTNMAGRGTDIKLGAGVVELGGLHVILTEMHEAGRIDRQLVGRCARQGDPGSYRQFLSLEDEVLLTGLGPDRAEFLAQLGRSGDAAIGHSGWLFEKAQRLVERRNFQARRELMHHEKERHKLKKQMGQDPYLD